MFWRRLILESSEGGDPGWHVEVGGRRIAALADRRYHDMFWDSYRLDPLTDYPEELFRLYSDDFWLHEHLVFRHREHGQVAPFAFPALNAGTVLRESGRLVVRGLHLPATCHTWSSLLLSLGWFQGRR